MAGVPSDEVASEAGPSTVADVPTHVLTDTIFLVLVVLELECEAHEHIRIGTLRLEALRWELRARTAEGAADRRGWTAWRTAVTALASDLARAEVVRVTLEDRHLGGREALSPDTLATLRELLERVATLLASVAMVPGGRRPRSDREIARPAERTAAEEAGILIHRVRARVLDVLGDHADAAASVERVPWHVEV